MRAQSLHAMVACLTLAACGGDSGTEPQCRDMNGSTQFQFTSQTTATGTVSGGLRGTFSTRVTNVTPNANGTQSGTLVHTFVTVPGDTLVMNAASVVTPVNQTTVRFEESLTAGRSTGAFRSASGTLTHRGEANLQTGAATGQYQGQLCGL